jgi:hypothetical protein
MFWGLTTAGLFYGVYLFRESIDFSKSKLSQMVPYDREMELIIWKEISEIK